MTPLSVLFLIPLLGAAFGTEEPCIFVAVTTFSCSTNIIVNNKAIPPDTKHVRIPLNGYQTKVTLYCGNRSKEFDFDNKFANQARVTYLSSSAQLSAYICRHLDGPTEEGLKCFVSTQTSSCPGGNGTSCVHVINSTTTLAGESSGGALDPSLADHVRAKVSGHKSITTVKYQSNIFVVIPPGVRFCVNVEAVSAKDERAPTGYGWRCKAPHYFHKDYDGSCTHSPQCVEVSCKTNGATTPPNLTTKPTPSHAYRQRASSILAGSLAAVITLTLT